jgi:hypothetical protein
MMKPSLILCLVFLADVAASLTAFWLLTSQSVPHVPLQPVRLQELTTRLGPVGAAERKLIDEINDANRAINTLTAKAEVVLARREKRTTRLSAEFFGEQPRRSRIVLRSWFGLECDFGSDDEHAWYWFKRRDPDHVYRGPYEQAAAGGLLDPVWVKDALGLVQIDPSQLTAGKEGDCLVLVNRRNGITRAMAIDEKRKLIVGNYLYDSQGHLVAFSEVQEHEKVGDHILPRVIAIGRPQEDTYTLWYFRDYRVNEPIDASRWEIPGHGTEMPSSPK